MKSSRFNKKNLLFSHHLDLYERAYFDNSQKYKDEVNSAIKNFPKNVSQVIDIGCGTGKHAAELLKRGYSVHCIDISRQAVNMTKNNILKYENGSVSLADIVEYKTDKKYNAAIAFFMVLSYIKRSVISNALQNVYNLLNPGGVFIFDVVNGVQINHNFEPKFIVSGRGVSIEWSRINCHNQRIIKATGKIKHGDKTVIDRQIFYYYYPDEIIKLLKMSGFKKINIGTDYQKGKHYKKQRTKLCIVCKK